MILCLDCLLNCLMTIIERALERNVGGFYGNWLISVMLDEGSAH